MSATIEGSSDGRRLYVRHLLATYGMYLFLAAATAATWMPRTQKPIRLGIVALMAVLVSASTPFFFRHYRELCERCIPKSWLTPQLAAEQNRWLLRSYHRPWFLLTTAGGFIVYGVVPLYTVASYTVGTVLILLLGVYLYGVKRHENLRPWCPWCQHGGGGGDVEVVPDVPVDSKPKVLT